MRTEFGVEWVKKLAVGRTGMQIVHPQDGRLTADCWLLTNAQPAF